MAGDRSDSLSYKAAGVDVEAGDRAVDLIRDRAKVASRPEVLGDIGGFAAAFAPRLAGLTDPVLLSATDGVGTKLAIAQTLDTHDTVGFDLVGMVVDDIVCHGGEPLFFLDYISCGRLVPERIAAIVGGIADACAVAGCALVGGETAEHPGVMDADEYDLAGFGVGIAERARLLGPDRVREGDAVVGIASSGLHSNGYSLVRKLILDFDLDLRAEVPALGRTLGEALLEPTAVYAPAILAVARGTDLHAAAHITGGGIAANTARAVPAGLTATLRVGAWREPPVFGFLRDLARIPEDEMRRTFNCGLGMVILLPDGDVPRALEVLGEHGHDAWVVGEVRRGDEGAVIEG